MKQQALEHVLEADRMKASTALKEGAELARSIHIALTGFTEHGQVQSLESAEHFLEHLEAAMTRFRRMMARCDAYQAGHADGMREGQTIGEAMGHELAIKEMQERLPILQHLTSGNKLVAFGIFPVPEEVPHAANDR
jgi:hypothetical protein